IGYLSFSASPANEAKSTRGNFVTLLSSISRKAIFDESGDHQYAVFKSSSSGYTQSSSPLRTSSVPPCVTECSFPSATFTTNKLCSRTKLTNFPSGEIFTSAIASFPCSTVRAPCVFKSNQLSELGPTNKSCSPFGAQIYCDAGCLPNPVACVCGVFFSGSTVSSFSALTSRRLCPLATSRVHSSVFVSFPVPWTSKNVTIFPSGAHCTPRYNRPPSPGCP